MAIAKKSVAIIPPQMKYDKSIRVEQKKLRVAAYCRVSTLLEEQENSYETQVEHFKNKIDQNRNWKLAGIFADEGKSATGTAHRDNFNLMIQACMNGEIDMVLTKSVSRFARNTVDCLENIRKLKEKRIPIIFEKEGINTMEGGGELLITILSSQAQEESRNISENTRWGVIRRFENGIVQVNHNKFLGFTKDENGNLVIVPEEAKIIRRIYREYLEGRSLLSICRGLEADGIKTVTGKDKWHETVIAKMLSNEKMMGAALMQKTYTEDFLTKKRVVNDGHVQQYFIEHNHEPIIPKELFFEVQAEKQRRANSNKAAVTRKKKKQEQAERSKHSSKFVLTNLMVCECGHVYRRQVWSKYGQKTPVWRCEDRLKNGKQAKCQASPTIQENELHKAIMTAINKVVEDSDGMISILRENVIRVIGGYTPTETTAKYDEQIAELQKQMLTLIEENAKLGSISEEFDEVYKHLSEEIENLKRAKMEDIRKYNKAEQFETRMNKVDKLVGTISPEVVEFDEELVKRLIQGIKVHRNMKLTIQFHSGITIEQDLDLVDW